MAVVGVIAIALSVTGLLLDAVRPGPVDVQLSPAQVPLQASGSYLAEANPAGPLGVCLAEACTPRTRIDLRLDGLPAGTYEARLEGPGESLGLGPLTTVGSTQVLNVDRPEDHTDKTRLVLLHVGLALHAWDVGAGERSLDGPVPASFGFAPVRLHLDEIGAVTVSTTGKATFDVALPSSVTLVARLESGSGAVVLGTFERTSVGFVLDGRIERVRLAEQDRITVYLVGDGRDGVPAWSAAL